MDLFIAPWLKQVFYYQLIVKLIAADPGFPGVAQWTNKHGHIRNYQYISKKWKYGLYSKTVFVFTKGRLGHPANPQPLNQRLSYNVQSHVWLTLSTFKSMCEQVLRLLIRFSENNNLSSFFLMISLMLSNSDSQEW